MIAAAPVTCFPAAEPSRLTAPRVWPLDATKAPPLSSDVVWLGLSLALGVRRCRRSPRTALKAGKAMTTRRRSPQRNGLDGIEVVSELNGKDSSSEATMLEVPGHLIQQLPPDIRSDTKLRDEYLLKSLEIGIRAVAQAGISLDTTFVKATFEDFANDVRRQSQDSQSQLQGLISSQLTGDDSNLARLLMDQLGERGHLASLLEDVCARLADPGRDTSLPNAISEKVKKMLDAEREQVAGLVNAADSNSPLGMFLLQQKQSVELLQSDYTRKSALLEEGLKQHMKDIRMALNVDQRLQAAQERIEAVTDKSTGKGVSFEEAGYESLVRVARNLGDRVEACGTELVDGTNRKIGDHLIHICHPGLPESAKIVVEQKAGKLGRKPMLRQMADAMQFRCAAAAIGLMQRKNMTKTQVAFDQHGPNQIIVGVDWTEDQNDWFALEVAYRTLRAQIVAAALQRDEESSLDVEALRAQLKSVESSLGGAQKIKVNATSAKASLESITATITEMEANIRQELKLMERTLGEI
mmetsp:Transcript_16186/g.28286  ORF Transcript_16186/g.28286 Transcript_16186/m.28286 type:complete len:525 (-) Transcript_16186:20-1594(-)|eukprot:CAMPEP_0197632196 /NCGR_PEP_ID=MMETSP1338-20131121/9059_1 /TAXON_ID=43686 ORGANISM="Pelagodinium beii, Strain RCC1491" /NCGR_SAMPLE_ID=MMETSP1338 /ASSEMBLY_ACC=CAM_ASM_000754 /LENGTH=524 /DNA_ID=CAMNT_0043203747 /DNA_START=41 /DNA_END=1615 /DNA_ORIENTATION=+